MVDDSGWPRHVVLVRALQAVAAPSQGEALAYLQDALALAEPEGYVRAFTDLGASMAELLRLAESRGMAPTYARSLLATMDWGAATDAAARNQDLVEPLSERELDVLRLLAANRTYHEIASDLFVSVNTVKTHLKNIYGKMGVGGRRQAAARARELGLV